MQLNGGSLCFLPVFGVNKVTNKPEFLRVIVKSSPVFFRCRILPRLFSFLWLMLCAPMLVFAQNTTLPPTLQAAINAAGLPAESVSFYVRAVDAPHPVFEQRAREAQNPASVMKLVTTYGALELLGPAYTWKTRFFAEAAVHDGVLRGPLYVRGGGDPRFLLEHLWLAIRALRAQGIRDLRDGLVLDRTIFDTGVALPGGLDGETHRAYNTPADGLLFNFKSTAIRFWPHEHGVTVTLDPVPARVTWQTQVRLSDEPCPPHWRSGLKFDLTQPLRLSVSGVYPRACGPRAWHLSLYDADEYFAQTWWTLWREAGGRAARDTVRNGSTPSHARLLYEAVSSPLAEVIRDVNKWSNNVMARQIFLTLSAIPETTDSAARPGQAEHSAIALKHWLAGKGVDVSTLVLENGSGLSRSERFSAQGLGQLLWLAYQSPLMPEFMASLPLVGMDGTMQRRLQSAPVQGRAHIKTGTLSDARAIAGYVHAASGRRYIVVSMINSPLAPAAQGVHDALLAWVYQLP